MLTGWIGAILLIPGVLWVADFIPAASWDQHVRRMTLLLLGIGAIVVAVDVALRRRELRASRGTVRPLGSILGAALLRWSAWLGLLGLAAFIYGFAEIYQTRWYGDFHRVFRFVIGAWIVFGLPWCLWTLRTRHGVRWDLRDPAILLVILLRRLWRDLRPGRVRRLRIGHIFRPRRARTAWLSLLVKAFFIPLMLTFFYHNSRDLLDAWVMLRYPPGTGVYDLAGPLYLFLFHSLLVIDVGLSTMGYATASRALGNGIRSVDATALGWISALLCYRPFADIVSWYVRWPQSGIVDMADSPFKLVLMVLVLGLLAIYVWATLAFGLRFSNLTHRGIVTGGPYRIVRHPAYIAKNLSWWFEYLPGLGRPGLMLSMLVWNAIYGVRAITEERHLRADPRYREYCDTVRWRFVPGWF